METGSFISHPVVILVIVFALSLIATFILFRFLKSDAVVITPKWRAGGAIGGFIIIFSLSFYSSDSWLSKYIYINKRFNVTGTVVLDSTLYYKGTKVEEMPPLAMGYSERDGNYTLNGVRFDAKSIKELTLSFSNDKYYPNPYKYTFHEKDFTIDYQNLQITINDTIHLKKIPAKLLQQMPPN